jgi:hypothetical protein
MWCSVYYVWYSLAVCSGGYNSKMKERGNMSKNKVSNQKKYTYCMSSIAGGNILPIALLYECDYQHGTDRLITTDTQE